MMVDTTTTGSRIQTITDSARIIPVHSGIAPSIGQLSLPSVEVTTQKPKIVSRQVNLPPKTPSQTKGSDLSAKKRKVPLRERKSAQSRQGRHLLRNDEKRQMKHNCSIAMSRTESIMVSSAGDVIVCRCRRSSTPFLQKKAMAPMNVWDRQLPCCDTDILSSIDSPWSPAVLQNVNDSKNGHTRIGSVSHVSTNTECSTYEWEKKHNNFNSNIIGVTERKEGSVGTNQGQELSDLERNYVPDKRSNEEVYEKEDSNAERTGKAYREKESLNRNTTKNIDIGDDLILSLPSFDYSHIIDGHNDMVPQIEQNDEVREKSVLSTLNTNARQQRTGNFFITSSNILENTTSMKIKKHSQSRSESTCQLDDGQKFFHGVPLFLSTLSQIHITKVSANPLGAHVLMISQEALLFSYGLNHCGQLGIGFQSEIKNKKKGFHTTPTLITPLLENGGKVINCAAGVDHSLVVVSTGGRRLQKLQFDPEKMVHSDYFVEAIRASNSPCQSSSVGIHESAFDDERDTCGKKNLFLEKCVQYHQVYGFGRNNFMKLGLVRPHFNNPQTDREFTEDVVLPRRVGLHSTVWPNEGTLYHTPLSQGVFDIAASTEHSSALVRRATGDVEVYMWGNASLGALGLPLGLKPEDIRGEIARKPFFKKKNISPLPTVLESLSHRRSRDPDSPFATKVSLGPYSSFVVMSNGKCMSCGFSAEGMLGHGYNITFSMEPREVFLPPSESDVEVSNPIVSISAGAFHALALSDSGDVYSWGINSNERLGLGSFDYSSIAPNVEEKKENLVIIEWVPQKIHIGKKFDGQESKNVINRNCEVGSERKDNGTRISLACAGYDSSFLVTESGMVLSFGKRSGRLGKGEISSNVSTPQALYGGLHLFRNRNKDKYVRTLQKKTQIRLRHRSVSTTALD